MYKLRSPALTIDQMSLLRYMTLPPSAVGYNTYVKVVGHSIGGGACGNARRGGKVLQIDDRTKLLHFLSSSDEEEGNDWLYLVIDDIVSANSMTRTSHKSYFPSHPFF